MLDRDKIERYLKPLFDILSDYQYKTISLQAKALKNALDLKRIDVNELNKFRSKILVLAKQTNNKIAVQYSKLFNDMVKFDIYNQMVVYNRGYEKGIIKSKPQVPSSISFVMRNEYVKEYAFMSATINRTAQYGGNKLAVIMQDSINQALSGIPTDRIAIDSARQIAEEGISITYTSGRQVNDLVAYTRQNLITSITQNNMSMQLDLFNSIDAEDKYYETSSHFGARPTHAIWQGRIFKSWTEFVNATGYGEVDGLGGVNCRHTFYPFIPEVSTKAFDRYNAKENREQYENMQQQRYLESQVRKWKTRELSSENLGVVDEQSKMKIRTYQAKLRDLTSSENLTRQYSREQI